jgi:hypothetical protein
MGESSPSDSEGLLGPHKNPKSFRVEVETRCVAINSRQGADHALFFCGPAYDPKLPQPVRPAYPSALTETMQIVQGGMD